MLKATAQTEKEGTAYMFGLSENDLNRLEFNRETIFFDFEYAGRPDLYGLIVYFPMVINPSPDSLDQEVLMGIVSQYLNAEKGVTLESLRLIVLPKPVIQSLRAQPFMGYECNVEIDHPDDIQVVFAARTEAEMQAYFIEHGFIQPKKVE